LVCECCVISVLILLLSNSTHPTAFSFTTSCGRLGRRSLYRRVLRSTPAERHLHCRRAYTYLRVLLPHSACHCVRVPALLRCRWRTRTLRHLRTRARHFTAATLHIPPRTLPAYTPHYLPPPACPLCAPTHLRHRLPLPALRATRCSMVLTCPSTCHLPPHRLLTSPLLYPCHFALYGACLRLLCLAAQQMDKRRNARGTSGGTFWRHCAFRMLWYVSRTTPTPHVAC